MNVFFFVHIPKCGGTTITKLFVDYFGEEYTLYEGQKNYHQILKSGDKNILKKYKFVSGHFCYGIHNLFEQKPIYISIVREPISRVLSAIKFIKSAPEHYLYPVLKDLSVDSCLKELIRFNETRLYTHQCVMIAGKHGNFDEVKQIINDNYFVVAPFDRINDLITILEVFIFKSPVKRLHLNKSEGEYQFSNESIQLIKELCKDDFELYDYVSIKFSNEWDYFLKQLVKSKFKNLSIKRLIKRLFNYTN
ncbi:MAG: sulfotransferase family 2 domain-containing protein [Candidatus Aenigmatarchaeota archaeon]